MWEAVRELVGRGTTVVLTTQYLEEADRLADRVSVVRAGRVVAQGSPERLKERIGGGRVEVVVEPEDLALAEEVLGRAAGVAPRVEADQARVSVPAGEGALGLAEVVRALDEAGLVVEDVALRRPGLDEVFLSLTGEEDRDG